MRSLNREDVGVAASPPGHQPSASAAVPASSQSGVPNADTILWCVHTIGPDDVNAAPDFDTAEEWATRQNRLMREYTTAQGMDDDPHWPMVRSVVAIWPWDAQSHADDLPHSIRDFTPPAPKTEATTDAALSQASSGDKGRVEG